MTKKILLITFFFTNVLLFAATPVLSNFGTKNSKKDRASFESEPIIASNDRYVSTSGNDSNDGLTEATAWRTITFAASKKSNLKAGDNVWIKAGNYGNENVEIEYSGVSGNPISFIGYISSPGDITSMYYTYSKDKPFDNSKMPTLVGNNRLINYGIYIKEQEYITIKNLQIRNYKRNILVSSRTKNLILDNILSKDADSSCFSVQAMNSENVTIRNSIAINAGMANFRIYGSNHLVENCKSYADTSGANVLDYYLTIRGTDHIIRDCYLERVGNVGHGGHGIALKAEGQKTENNLVENCKVVNIDGSIELRHSQVKNNLIRNIEIRGPLGKISIRDGASYNTVENIYMEGTTEGIRFFDQTEDGQGGNVASHNIIRNSVFHNMNVGITASKSTSVSKIGTVTNNSIENCTFSNISTLFKAGLPMDNTNSITNSIFANIGRYSGSSSKYPIGWVQTYNNYYKSGFTTPSNAGNISGNPRFVDVASGDFHLGEGSSAVDRGIDISSITADFDGVERPQGVKYDMGAFEKKNFTNPVNADAGVDVSICTGSSATLTASGGTDYMWSTGETTASIIVSPTVSTIYTVTVSEGSESDSDEVEVSVDTPPSVSLPEDVTICSGDTITLTATGTGNFVWNTGETTSSIEVSPTVNTTYSITAANSCDATGVSDEIIVNVGPEITLDAGEDKTICIGENIVLTATGNTGNFVWNTGETTASITVNPTATTIYTVTSSLGDCSLTDEVEVTVDTPPSVSLPEDVAICEGEEVTLTAAGTGNFVWNTGETTSSILVDPTTTTTYSVTATSSCDTTGVSDEIIVNVTPEITVNAGEDKTICVGENIVLTATGNTGNFVWNTGETAASITVNPTATTIYTVTSSSGDCSRSDEIVVTVDTPPSVSLPEDVAICEGEEVTLTATGTGSFIWSTGETTSSILVDPTATTTYSVTATSSCDATGVSDEIIVNVTPEITVNAGEDETICSGENIVLTATGNTGNFVWNTGETTASITINPTATTIYTVTSSSGDCSRSDEIVVTVDTPPSVNFADEETTICEGEEVTLIAEGTGYFLWNTGETSSSITVSPTATTTYSVTATSSCDTAGVSDEIIVNVTPEITIDAGEDKTICSGENIILTATGNTGNFVWSTGETSSSITVNPTVTTIYTVTSSLGSCSLTDEVEVIIETPPSVNLEDGEVAICSGDSITLTAEGEGDFLWSTGETTSSITVNPTATTTYTVTASNSSLCDSNNATDQTIVTVNPVVTLDAGEDKVICLGESVVLTVEGNTGNFLWSTGETSSSITVNPTVTTVYSVKSSSGDCSMTDEVEVIVESPPSASLPEDMTICEGAEVTLTVTGIGNFLWSTGETGTSINVSPLETTTYTVIASSSTGVCTDSVTGTITVNVNKRPVATANDDLVILSGSSVDLTVSGEGSFEWSTGEVGTRISVSPTVTTTYTVTATTGEGCSVNDEVVVTVVDEFVPSVITLTAGQDLTICPGDTVILEAPRGTRYLWSSGETENSIRVSPSETTVYSVKVYNGDDSETSHSTITVRENCNEDISALTNTNSFDLDQDMTVYPNPTTGLLNVKLKGYNNDSRIAVYSLNGTMLSTHLIDNKSRASVLREQLDLSKFPKGVYFVQLTNNGNSQTKKVILN